MEKRGKRIFYDRCFIEVEGRYVPIVQHGNTNSWENDAEGKRIAEKNWSILTFAGEDKILLTEAEIRKMCDDSFFKLKFLKNHKSYHEDFKAWFISGIESAKSIEDTVAAGNTLMFIAREMNKSNIVHHFRTTKELYYLLNEYGHLAIDVMYYDREYKR